MIIELPGKINEHGQLEVELPAGLPRGNVTVQIQFAPPPPPEDEAEFRAHVQRVLEKHKALMDELAKR